MVSDRDSCYGGLFRTESGSVPCVLRGLPQVYSGVRSEGMYGKCRERDPYTLRSGSPVPRVFVLRNGGAVQYGYRSTPHRSILRASCESNIHSQL